MRNHNLLNIYTSTNTAIYKFGNEKQMKRQKFTNARRKVVNNNNRVIIISKLAEKTR